MTEKRMQQIVAKAIAETDIDPTRYYHICWWEGRVRCSHVHHTKEIHPVFFGVPGDALIDGLTPHQWRLITTRIMDFCRTRNVKPAGDATSRKGRTHRQAYRERLQITEFDSWRLRSLLASSRSPDSPPNPYLDKLQQLLETADRVAPENVPANVVTMNSQVRLRDDHDSNEMSISLVFPADAVRDADLETMKVSVLTPIGLAILGRRVGDAVEGRIRVHELLYQPEAAGNFDL